MIVSINQPAYLPWLGYFDRIARSDLHIVLDNVQFEKNSFTNRNRVRTREGSTWLTVPLRTKGRFGNLPISEIEMADGDWRRKHWQTLLQLYRSAPHFAAHSNFFEQVYGREWPRLSPLLRETTDYLCAALDIRTRMVYSSELKVDGAKAELVLNLCREVGATRYLSGPLGRDYLDPSAFKTAGIGLEFQDYQHPVYPQRFPGFESHLSIVDLLFNCGPVQSTAILSGKDAC